MQLVQKPMHPIHIVNYYNSVLKRILREQRPPRNPMEIDIPHLVRDVSYYFTFAMQAREEFDKMLWALCCFAADGEIIFNAKGAFDVSLWHFRRQGLALAAKRFEGTIRTAFRRNGVPLDPNNPFQKVGNDLYWCNINWFTYKKSLEKK